MKKIYSYIILLCTLMLIACEGDNWFLHTVEYNGKVDKPEMVVTGTLNVGHTPLIYVNESVFFLDSLHNEGEQIYEKYIYDDKTYRRYVTHVRKGWLTDAQVTMKVNGGDAISLHGGYRWDSTQVTEGTMTICKNYAFTCDYVLQPNDKVEIEVTHSNYAKPARVSQVIPAPAKVTIESIEFSPISATGNNYVWMMANATLHLAPTEADSSCLLCFTGKIYTTQKHHIVRTGKPDEIEYINFRFFSIYSQDLSFVGYDQTNQSLSSGYYGANTDGLYRAANKGEETIRVGVVYEEANWSNSYMGGSTTVTTQIDSIVWDVKVVTRDQYLLTSSMFAAGYNRNYVMDYFSDGTSNDSFFNEISDMFDELGGMEGVQIYGNVENAIGHVTASSTVRYTYKPE